MAQRLLVFATPRAGAEEEYEKWYSEVHIPEMLEIPGVVSAEWHRLVRGGPDDESHLSVFVLAADAEATAVLGELRARSTDGRMTMSPAVDPTHTKITVYEAL
ncbi:DUF4286 family protein [Nocardia takedensis]|uniref:DUF4286 family protein n=1 Tax=Nocardia takedensis TaxID=259390 RepID=UPI0003040755|nr:DUF4286 family protein [Nocardia takedensis]